MIVKALSDTGLESGNFGIGMYRMTNENPQHKELIKKAINFGFNIFDTAANFMNGGSEKIIGELIEERPGLRDKLLIISKAGFIQGSLLKHLQSDQSHLYHEIVHYNDDCWQCMSDEFLRDELNRSLNRLNTQKIDFFLIQNPEYYLLDAFKKNIAEAEIIRENFYRRLKSAFLFLESAVKDGKISYYGICSNSLGQGHQFYESIDTGKLFTLLDDISSEYLAGQKHHFKAIELAVNINEYNKQIQETINLLKEQNFLVFANRPLNTIHNGRLRRIADYSDEIDSFSETKVRVITQAIGSLEQKILQYFKEKNINYSFNEKESFETLLQFSEALKKLLSTAIDIDQINPVFNRYFYLNLKLVLDKATELNPNDDIMSKLFLLMERSLQELEIQLKLHSKKTITEDSKLLIKEKAAQYSEKKASQAALLFASTVKGIDVVFTGASRDKYLDDLIEIIN